MPIEYDSKLFIEAERLSRLQLSVDLQPQVKRIIVRHLAKASRDISSQIPLMSDPRDARRAVKYMAYRQILGGNVSILRRLRGNMSSLASYNKVRKLDSNPNQRGGNRRTVSADTLRRESYTGAERSFVLNFLNSGTSQRMTIYGNRGRISAHNFFSPLAFSIVGREVEEIISDIDNLVKSYTS